MNVAFSMKASTINCDCVPSPSRNTPVSQHTCIIFLLLQSRVPCILIITALYFDVTRKEGSLRLLPVSAQKAPWVLGEVSPTLAWANAAVKLGCVSLLPASAAHFSMSWAATPLLSPLMSEFVLLMEVQCTGNQLMDPTPLQQPAHVVSTTCLLLSHRIEADCHVIETLGNVSFALQSS